MSKQPAIPRYEVLRAIVIGTGQKGTNPETGKAFEWYVCKWLAIGHADSMAEAKEKFGGSPVLREAVGTVH